MKLKSSSYTWLAFRPDDQELWVSEVTRDGPDSVQIVSLSDTSKLSLVGLVKFEGHPVPAGITFSQNGKSAFIALSRNNSLVVVDVESRQLRKEIGVGIAPFSVVVSKKRNRVFVSNRGGEKAGPG